MPFESRILQYNYIMGNERYARQLTMSEGAISHRGD